LILRWIRVIRMGVAAAVGFAGSAFVLLFLLVCRVVVVVVELGAEYHLGERDGMLGHPPSPDRAEPALWVLRPVDFRGKAYRKGYEDGRDWCQAPNHRCIEYPTSSDESP
jgi:hypothetical protein